MLGRRQFLGKLSAGMAMTLVPAGVITAAGLASLRDRFAGLVDDNLHLVDSAGVVKKARLVALDDGPACPGIEQFSIVLEGSDITEGLHEVYHPNAGGLQIALMETAEPGSGGARQRAYVSSFV